MEIHEDQPLVEPAAGPTRKIWVPLIHRFNTYPGVQAPSDTQNTFIASGTFEVPHDFTAWTRIRLVVFGNITQPYNITIRGDAGTCGELYTTHNQTIVQVVNLVLNRFTCIDLSALMAAFFGALSPGDYVQMQVTNNTVGIVTTYGFDLRY